MPEPLTDLNELSARLRPFREFSLRCDACSRQDLRRPRLCAESWRKVVAARQRWRRERLRAAGLCIDCGRARATAAGWCEECYLKQKARRTTGKTKNWRFLQQQWREQGGRCFYTGRQLRLGENASIDHIVPRAKGGTNDPANLVWVLDIVNTMKGDIDRELLLQLCAELVAHHA